MRSDYTPTYYRDTGCEDGLLPSCLECPLPVCRYELNTRRGRLLVTHLRRAAAYARRPDVHAVARAQGCSPRAVFRSVALVHARGWLPAATALVHAHGWLPAAPARSTN